MRAFPIAGNVLPLGEFKARAAQILRDLPQRRAPLIITQNGRAACVILSPDDFDRMQERQAFLEAVTEGLSDLDAGRTIGDDELGARLDAAFGPLEAR